jgi:hypothetical protein
MNIHQIQDLSNKAVVDILKTGLTGVLEPHLSKNYSPEFANVNSNLFYILEKGRYSTGMYYVLEDNGEFVASAGWNEYTADTALVLSRAFVSEKYRTTYVMGEYLLPLMITGANHYDHVWITCNEYNKAIYNWFVRSAEGRSPAMFANWPPIYLRFKPIGKRIVYNTEQYVAELQK